MSLTASTTVSLLPISSQAGKFITSIGLRLLQLSVKNNHPNSNHKLSRKPKHLSPSQIIKSTLPLIKKIYIGVSAHGITQFFETFISNYKLSSKPKHLSQNRIIKSALPFIKKIEKLKLKK